MAIKEKLKEFSIWFNKHLKNQLKVGIPQKLFDAMHYSLNAGGKRIRPFLMFESAKICGKNNTDIFLDIAIAIEMIHTYSLIHDDLPSMDNDDLRRGKPTCHKVFGEAIAILAGDGLLTHAFEKISSVNLDPEKIVKIINILAKNTGIYGMVAGQAGDILAEKEGSFQDIKFIHENKTTKFIQACCEIGAVLADANEEKRQALRTYGYNIGMAFQIWDDVLDVIGDTEKLGKTVGKDINQNKLTYPSIYGLKQSKEIAKSHIEKAIESISIFKENETLVELAKFIIQREV
ncbi:MAG: polyprenyl synthetase family protein [Hydrogenothermus sp.]|nr:MAG: polyprenyl synthetase family protein [Hydrogenothermus sp.]